MDKLEKLKEVIRKYSSAVIAFSGGVDSTLVARVSKDVLSDKVLLVTATSSTYPEFELEESKEIAKQLGIEQRIIKSEEIDIPGFSDNPPDRCYYCKHELFTLITDIAQEMKYEAVFDGSNADDLCDYRPGMRAIKELHIVSPLCEAALTKKDIRYYSDQLNLPTATKPSFACLASRFPYGEKITREKLDRAGKSEKAIRDLGFTQFRVRCHGDLARLEFIPEEIDRAWQMRDTLETLCTEAGFTFVALDTRGYRTGAMNEMLDAT